MSSPANLNEFALAMEQTNDVYKKLTICEALVRYLKNPRSDVTIDEQGPFCMSLINWMTSPSLKISVKALEIALNVLERMPMVFKPHVGACFPSLIERYADSKEAVRNGVHKVLMGFLEKEILSPQQLHDKLSAHGYKHKNSVVRVESLKCLMNILTVYQAKSLQLSSSTQVILKLYGDQSESVREQAANVLVEMYRQVGEKLRVNITKSYSDEVPQQRLAALFAKFNLVRDPENKKFDSSASGESSLSRPESVEDFNDGPSRRNNFSKASSVSSRNASIEDLTKKAGLEKKTNYGTLGRSRAAPASATNANAAAGAVDEATFRAAFLDVPKMQVFGASGLRDAIKAVATTIANPDEDWEKRVDAFRKIRAISIAVGDHADFPELIKKLEIPILDALKDLRSQVVREACITISFLAEGLKAKFTYFAEFLFPSLVSLIQNSAKVMSTSALVAVRFIVENTCSLRLVSLTVNSISSKSKDIRRAMCEILCIILSTWPVATLEKKHSEIRVALQKGIGDADPEARQSARKAFCAYKSKFPERADELLRSLDSTYRRMLCEGSETVTAASSQTNLASARSASTVKKAPVAKRPSFTRSNTAMDAQAVQRANVRAQYAAMHRLKAGTGVRSPITLPSSMVSSTVGLPEDASRSRPRAPRYSRSQPTSRSASPCAQFNYQTYQSPSPSVRARHAGTGIPGPRSSASSLENSRETSPTRFGCIPKARRRIVVTPQHPPPAMPSLSQRMLQQSREAEHDLANMFMRNETDGARSMSGERSSDESETSSITDRSASSAPATVYLTSVEEMLDHLNRTEWSDRKQGLFSLRLYLTNNSLSRKQLKRATDALSRMFMDSQTKVYTLFLDTILNLIRRHSFELDDWLYILLIKLFMKLGTDVLPTTERKILDVLALMREKFTPDMLLKDTFKFIADPTQTHTVKTRLHLLRHISELADLGSTVVGTTEQRSAVLSKLIRWSETPEVTESATKCIADLFKMNAYLIITATPLLTSDEQLVINSIVEETLKKTSACKTKTEVNQILREIQTHRFDGINQDVAVTPGLARLSLEDRLVPTSPATPQSQVEEPVAREERRSQNGSSAHNDELWIRLLDTLNPDSNFTSEEKLQAISMARELISTEDGDVLAPYIMKITQRLMSILLWLEDKPAPESGPELQLITAALICFNKLIRKKGAVLKIIKFNEFMVLKIFFFVNTPNYSKVITAAAEECLLSMAQNFPIEPLLNIFQNYAVEKGAHGAYFAIKGIEEIVKHHSKEELDPFFEDTMRILLMAFDSNISAIRKAVVFCLVAIHKVYGEAAMAPYLCKLDSSKRKLLDIYIKRQKPD